MAGYVSIHQGYVYNGKHQAAEVMPNGVFAEITTDGVKKITAAGDMKLRVLEKFTMWGMDFVRLEVVNPGTKEHYFVENEWDINDAADYNTAEYECKIGDYVRMHRLLADEEVVMSVATSVAATLTAGDMASPAAGGTIAKASA